MWTWTTLFDALVFGGSVVGLVNTIRYYRVKGQRDAYQAFIAQGNKDAMELLDKYEAVVETNKQLRRDLEEGR